MNDMIFDYFIVQPIFNDGTPMGEQLIISFDETGACIAATDVEVPVRPPYIVLGRASRKDAQRLTKIEMEKIEETGGFLPEEGDDYDF